MVEARQDHRKSPSSSQFTDVLVIKMHDCEVKAIAHARHQHLYADERAVNWMHTGLRRAVKNYIGNEMQAMSHTAAKSIGEQFTMVHMRHGVRDKVSWSPDNCKWKLDIRKAPANALKDYLHKHGISLDIPQHLPRDEFKAAREEIFRVACQVWNDVDQSGRRRIQVPPRPLNVEVMPVLKDSAMSQTESDHDSDELSQQYDEEELFS